MSLGLINFSPKVLKCPHYFCKILNYLYRFNLLFSSVHIYFFLHKSAAPSTSRTFSHPYKLLCVAAPLFKPISFFFELTCILRCYVFLSVVVLKYLLVLCTALSLRISLWELFSLGGGHHSLWSPLSLCDFIGYVVFFLFLIMKLISLRDLHWSY